MRLLTAALAALPALALAQGLDISVTKPVQCTRKTQNGDTIAMKYKGTLTDGTQFDSNYDSGRPFEFKLGSGQVIPGWDAGVEGMKVGGRRKLTIPSAMAYGARGAGGGVIKPHEPLVFVVDLLAVG